MAGNRKQVTYGALLSYFSIFANILAGLLYTPWMVRQIGQSQYGLYTLAYSVISLFLIDFGLSSAVARYVSNYHAAGEEEKVNGILGVVYKLYLAVDAVVFAALLIVYFSIETIYASLTPMEIQQFKVVYAIAAVYSVISFPFVTLNGILTAYEKFIQLKLADVIYRLLVVALTVIALLLGKDVYVLVAVNAAAGLLIIAYKYAVIRKTTKIKVNFRYRHRGLYKEICSYSLWITVAALAQRLIFNITPTILGVVSNTGTIAVFGIVTTIEGYTYTLATAINGLFMPKISRIYAGEEKEGSIDQLMLKVGKFQFFVNGLIVAGFACVGSKFISLWMGDAYADAYWGILLVIIPGIFYNSLQIAHTSIMVQNKVKITAIVNVIMGVINVLLVFVLARKYGIVGACAAIFVAYMFRAIALCVTYKRALEIDLATFIKKCYGQMSVPVLITMGIGKMLDAWIPIQGWSGLVVEALCIVGIYMITGYSLVLSQAERRSVVGILKRKMR